MDDIYHWYKKYENFVFEPLFEDITKPRNLNPDHEAFKFLFKLYLYRLCLDTNCQLFIKVLTISHHPTLYYNQHFCPAYKRLDIVGQL